MEDPASNGEEDVGHRVMTYNGHAKPNGSCKGSGGGYGSERTEDGNGEPYVGMEFETEDLAKSFYDEYARRSGFNTKAGPSSQTKPDGVFVYREFLCQEGSKRRGNDSCEAMIRIELNSQNRWVVTRFKREHSHYMVSSRKVQHLRSQKLSSGAAAKKNYEPDSTSLRPHKPSSGAAANNGSEPDNTRLRPRRPSSGAAANNDSEPDSTSLRPHKPSSGAAANNNSEPEQGPGVFPGGWMYVPEYGRHFPMEPNQVTMNRPAAMDPFHAMANAAAINYTVQPFIQRRTLGRDAQNLLEYFKKMQAENPGFFYAIQLDDDNRMANAFWADARCRTAYSYFGDAVTLDTSYRVNQYKVPCAPFTGVNHHGQTILFGCAILLDESEASFVWLLKTFLTAMNDEHPASITTDQDRVMKAAVSQVLPQTRHCICKWSVLREGQERLAYVCHTHPNFQLELYNCINMTETVKEFESSWDVILDKYNLRGNDWLQSLYDARAQWVPVFFRDSFFAVISPNQRYEGFFFDGYVNQQTTLPVFFRQYERALDSWFEKELEADFDTIYTKPVLKTPSPMEKQAADLYTQKIFTKFQDELVETFVYTANRIDGDRAVTTFRVAKFEDDQKAYTVTLNHPELKADCSCHMFEYSGILCRHILTVFTITNVLQLPSHYILKRWTRNAKNGTGTDENGSELQGQVSLTARYNNLCWEAIRYAEEGAVTAETYNVAVGALREGVKKVAVVKKNVAKVAPPSSKTSGTGNDKSSMSSSDVTPLLWPRQDEMTRRFNLTDGGAHPQSVADLNMPQMAPISLHQDNGTTANMAVLPCLKSMTWTMENKVPGTRVAVITLKLQDYTKFPSTEVDVKFQLTKVTLEPMLRSMAYISEQLSIPANKVAVINLKLQDTETTSGESEVKFQVSKDTLGAMLRSMAYIREQLSSSAETPLETPSKRHRK